MFGDIMDSPLKIWQPGLVWMDWRYHYYFNSVKRIIDKIKLVKIHYNRKMKIALDIMPDEIIKRPDKIDILDCETCTFKVGCYLYLNDKICGKQTIINCGKYRKHLWNHGQRKVNKTKKN